jgi:ATP-binding protein involved in chromosome partitioning
MAMPLEIVGLGRPEVTFVWDEGDQDVWGARALRIRCVCAHCRSETTGERLLDEATVPEDLAVSHMELVGNYGVGIHFTDGHTTGIFRFADLRRPR